MDCPQCGKALDVGKVFCKNCGARVASAPMVAETPAPKAPPTPGSVAAEAPHVGEEMVGRRLGRYEITELIGRGGMATVYRAEHPGLGTAVAIKVLHPHLAGDPAFVGRFRREAHAVSALRHPNIVRVLDFDNQGDLYYMVLEYIDGPPLSTYLTELHDQGRRLSPEETLRLFTPLCSALDYAHGQGMIHRDIKPANIMLTSDHVPVITDYGIAKIIGATSYTSPGLVVGSVHYMSPEQAQGLPSAGRSDIYSLGVVLFEVVAGRVPFEGETPVSVIVQHLSSPVPAAHLLNPDVSPAVEAVLDKALAKDAEQRYERAGDLARALAEALGPGNNTVVPPATGAEPTRPESRAGLDATRVEAGAAAAISGVAAAGAAASTPAATGPGIGASAIGPGPATPAAGSGGPPAPSQPSGAGWSPPPGWIADAPPREKARGKRGLIIGVVAAVVVLVGGGTAAALYFASPNGPDDNTTQTTDVIVQTTIMPPDDTLPTTVTTLPGTAATALPRTTSTIDVAAYEAVLAGLDTVLTHSDTRIPELADKINATAPSVPASVNRELETLYTDIQRAREELGKRDAPPPFQRADDLIFQAAEAMQYRIDQTMKGVDAMLSAGNVEASHPYFEEGRKARDEFRKQFADYKAARP
jgi:hypothetical protein